MSQTKMSAVKPTPPEVKNPKRILVIGAPNSGLLEFLTEFSGSAPTPVAVPGSSATSPASLAGLQHQISLKTNYYTATVPIWLDELPASPSAWASEFLLPEAKEVLSALGGLVLLFRKPATAVEYEGIKDGIKAVGKVVIEGLGGGIGGSWEGVALAVAWRRKVVPGLEFDAEEWEDWCWEKGFEFVDGEDRVGSNDYGEKTGVPRVLEALEANDWTGDDDDLDDHGFGSHEDEGFDAEATELEMEMFGMKRAIRVGGDVGEEFNKDREQVEGDEDGVDGLEGLMLRMQGIREIGADMPEAERKKFAAKAVRDIMKTV